jgi:predicted  nucleic acid-binding Zn-ribbon protein
MIFLLLLTNTNDPEQDIISSVFPQNEILQIKAFTKRVDSMVMAETNTRSIALAYSIYFDHLVRNQKSTGCDNDADKQDQSIAKIVTSLKGMSLFNNIWLTEESKNYSLNKRYESIIINPDGSYLKFLKQLSKRDNLFDEYYQSINEMYDIVPTNRGWFSVHYREFNINDFDIHFLVSVHLVTTLYKMEIAN